jgi:hypothetical protein
MHLSCWGPHAARLIGCAPGCRPPPAHFLWGTAPERQGVPPCSVVLEMVEFIRAENIKALVSHLVEKFGAELAEVDYVDTFQALRLKYDQVGDNGRLRDVFNGMICSAEPASCQCNC